MVKSPKLDDAASYNIQLGLAYLKQGDRVRAKKKLFLALKQAPTSPTVNTAMAYFMEHSGEKTEALQYYQKAMASAPGAGAELNNYGAFLCRQGQYKQADLYFMKAVSDKTYDHTAGAYENAGLCALAMPNRVLASRYFLKALSHDPTRSQSLYELVQNEIKQQHFHEALHDIEQYATLVRSDRTLLVLAEHLAEEVGNATLKVAYQQQLAAMDNTDPNFSDKTGETNEYNSNNNG